MPEHNAPLSRREETLLRREQEKTKPAIGDIIPEYLDGEVKKNVQDFAAYLQSNNIPLKWVSLNGWRARYKGEHFCWVFITGANTWRIAVFLAHKGKYEETIINEGLRHIFWNGFSYCVHSAGQSGKGCSPTKACAGGDDRTIFGKQFKGVCRANHYQMATVWNPDESTVSSIKRLLNLEMKARDE